MTTSRRSWHAPALLFALTCSCAASNGAPLERLDEGGADSRAAVSAPAEDAGTADEGLPVVDSAMTAPIKLESLDGSRTLRSCTQDSDCTGGDPCVTYVCPPTSGELSLRTCVIAAISDAGGCNDDGGEPVAEGGEPVAEGGTMGLPPIDPQCAAGGLTLPEFPPYTPLAPPDVPATCANGFEIGDANFGSMYTIDASAAGAGAIVLDVDFATYLQADAVIVTGTDASGATYTLLDTCRLQTWTAADPTGGTSRPPDETLRQFRIQVRQGTTQLNFDFSGVVSPMYIQVLGLCDFNVVPFSAARWWQAVP